MSYVNGQVPTAIPFGESSTTSRNVVLLGAAGLLAFFFFADPGRRQRRAIRKYRKKHFPESLTRY